MENRSSITALQFALLAGGNAIIIAYTFIPIANTDLVGLNTLYTLLLSLAYILVMNMPVLFIMTRFRNATVNEMLNAITGKAIGKILAALLALFFLMNFTMVLSISVYYIKSYLLPNTPTWALITLTMIPVIYTACKGSGTLARMATVIIPLLLFTVAVFFIAGLDKMQWTDLPSLTGCTDFKSINKCAFFSASRYSEILMMNMFCRNLMKKSSIVKTYAASVGIYIIGIIFIIIPTLLTLGVPFAKLQLNPYFIYCRQVGQQGIFQKLQGVNIYFWYLGVLYKLAIYLYMASSITAGLCKKFPLKPVTTVIGGIMFIVSNIPILYNIAILNVFAKTMFVPLIIASVVFAIPLILLAVSLIRKKHIKSEIEKINMQIEKEGVTDDFEMPKTDELFPKTETQRQ